MSFKKTLIAVGIASTMGMGSAAMAGNTPFPVSVDDNNPSASWDHRQGSMITWSTHQASAIESTGSTSTQAGGTVGGSMDLSSAETMDLSAMEAMDEFALLDQGVYSDYYVISMSPDLWDYYTITPASGGDDFYLIDPGYTFIVLEDDA